MLHYLYMRKTRLNYTSTGKPVLLIDWIRARGMTQKRFGEFLAQRGLGISPALCISLFNGSLPGPKFRMVFREVTGITIIA